MQGVGGAVQYPKNYLKEAYKLVRERGGVCIADEVRVTIPVKTSPSMCHVPRISVDSVVTCSKSLLNHDWSELLGLQID